MSSSSSSSSSSSEKQKRKQRDDDINAKIAARMAKREQEENAWQGWICPCGGKNFVMKGRCYACNALKPLSGAQKGLAAAEKIAQSIARAHLPPEPKKKPEPPSSSSSSSSSRYAKSRSRSRSRSREAPATHSETEEIMEAKAQAVKRLEEIKDMQGTADQKEKAFKKLLREWHPDKNVDRVQVCTAVFQFLQKARHLFKHG
ncbi:unnamed protein product [Cladocopium goreaui]|uniref:Uncharacterized protein n=1 Tax=Cladocopium goreaui TaxID=2562237 RepID=A0A9P1DHM0_9DINO|nr:unnamed protein product [Cladocopium goreaui]